jgi:hypothetical protein
MKIYLRFLAFDNITNDSVYFIFTSWAYFLRQRIVFTNLGQKIKTPEVNYHDVYEFCGMKLRLPEFVSNAVCFRRGVHEIWVSDNLSFVHIIGTDSYS